jgi:hypothetical protein
MYVDFNILNQLGSPSINSNTFANRPAAGQTGRLFVSTDTFEIYRDNGTTWDEIGGPAAGTITGTGTATQVAYFTSAQVIGSSANLFFDATNNRLGVGTSAPAFTIEANGDILAEAIYLDGATAGNGALYWTSDRVTLANYNASGIVHIETAGGAAAATFGADLTATITSGIGTRGFTGSTSYAALLNGSVGINTATPGAALDVHSTGTIAQFNTTSGSGNTYVSWQRAGTGLWRLGDTYNGGSNFFELHNTTLAIDALEFEAATNKSTFQATQTYTTGLARANYLDYNLSVAAGGSFSSPNAITALGASLDLTLAGNATIPSGARSGLDAYNSVSFTGTGTLTHTQGTQIRAYSNLTTGWAFSGSATGTITHLAGMRVLFPDNTGSAVSVTNNYALLINDQTANTGTVTYTNRYGIYQEGASDTNYFAATTLVGTNVNSGYKFEVSGSANATTLFQNGVQVLTTASISGTTNFITKFTSASAIGNSQIFDNGTSIGIGTANPSVFSKLSVIGNIFCSDNSEIGWITLQSNPPTDYITGNQASHNIRFITDNVERLRITSGGNVGIGTTSPSYKLDVKGGNASTLRLDNDGSQYVQLMFERNTTTNSGADFLLDGTNGTFGLRTLAAYPITFSTSASAGSPTERMRIFSDGNVGINTGSTNAGFKLDVNGTLRASGAVTVSNATSVKLSLSGGITQNGIILDAVSPANQFYIGAGINLFTGSGTAADRGIVLGLNTSILTAAMFYDGNNDIRFGVAANTELMRITNVGNVELFGSMKTGAPSGGTAAAWKFGERVASAGVTFNNSQYIQLDVNGTAYYLATVDLP